MTRAISSHAVPVSNVSVPSAARWIRPNLPAAGRGVVVIAVAMRTSIASMDPRVVAGQVLMKSSSAGRGIAYFVLGVAGIGVLSGYVGSGHVVGGNPGRDLAHPAGRLGERRAVARDVGERLLGSERAALTARDVAPLDRRLDGHGVRRLARDRADDHRVGVAAGDADDDRLRARQERLDGA